MSMGACAAWLLGGHLQMCIACLQTSPVCKQTDLSLAVSANEIAAFANTQHSQTGRPGACSVCKFRDVVSANKRRSLRSVCIIDARVCKRVCRVSKRERAGTRLQTSRVICKRVRFVCKPVRVGRVCKLGAESANSSRLQIRTLPTNSFCRDRSSQASLPDSPPVLNPLRS